MVGGLSFRYITVPVNSGLRGDTNDVRRQYNIYDAARENSYSIIIIIIV